ncbi:MAG TPA: DcaP family trimeric outer membrane transporter [Candidatus Krumholzibacteria bacterium]|nr:DcaP family trimeric outer membrane transporter [Candidatus Krumholzibacteria bacterium]
MKVAVLSLLLLCGVVGTAAAQDTSFDLYGFIMMDAGYDTKQVDPAWFDVLRTTKLPSFKDQFAPDGNMYFSVRQTRFGVKSSTPTDLGDFTTQFEWELFGVGADAGQTTIRLRHAYGQLGKFGAGQTWSPFMDIDVFPNTVEYWGPPGMAFFRNVQLRFMPLQGDTRFTIALERPGASGDGGTYSARLDSLGGVQPHFPLPDLSAEYRMGKSWGYVELAGIVRRIEWEDPTPDVAPDLSGNVTGWGLNLSTNVKVGDNNTFRGSILYGEGVENYMNDAPADVAIDKVNVSATAPLDVIALPVTGIVAFLDHNWNEKFSSSVGYSSIDIDNAEAQATSAFHRGQYAIGNLMYYPVPNVMTGVELQWGKRENFKDDPITGFNSSDDFRIQASFKYNFSKTL